MKISKMDNETYAKWLEGCGLDRKTACQMAGIDPAAIEKKRFSIAFYLMIVALVVFFVLLAATYAGELLVMRPMEQAMLSCLNGGVFHADNVWFKCERLGVL